MGRQTNRIERIRSAKGITFSKTYDFEQGMLLDSKQKDDVWDSGLNIICKPTIVVPHKIQRICASIKKKFIGNEFSILCKGEMKESKMIVSPEYIIPKQTVSGASVDYDEPLDSYKNDGYNVVIHAHPDGLRRFSGADDDSININFDCSILYVDGNFPVAVMPIRFGETSIMLLDCDVVLNMDEVEVNTENIKVRKWTSTYSKFRDLDDVKPKYPKERKRDRAIL
jgi:hypothetical protein